jgi:hypothetical protein
MFRFRGTAMPSRAALEFCDQIIVKITDMQIAGHRASMRSMIALISNMGGFVKGKAGCGLPWSR